MANLTVSTDVDNFMQAADNAAARTSLQVPSTDIQIIPGIGLSGGGDLNANRTISVDFGSSGTTVCVGNDARLSNTRTPSAHAISHGSGGTDQITTLALTTGTITTAPGSANDIVNKTYADSIGSGVNFHDACDYGTIAVLSPSANYNQPGGAGIGVNATLTGSTNVPLVVDGVTVATGKRILVKNQTSTFQNGIYNVTQQGDNATVPYILTRASDYDTSGSGINEVQAGDFVIVLNSTLANTAWVQQTPAPINFGVTPITFIQFAAANPGVTSFNTTLTGLTPSTNTTGAVTLAGTLGITNGGTGATTQQEALNAISGAQTSGYHFRSNGTNVSLQPLSASDVTAGTLQITNGGTGSTTGDDAMNALGFPIQIRPVTSFVNLATGTTSSFVYTATTAVPSFVSQTVLSDGDLIHCSAATNTMNLGPWIVTTTGYQAKFIATLAAGSTSLNVTSIISGTLAVGQNIVIPASTNTVTIASFGTGTGGIGTYNLSASIGTAQTNVTMASGTGVQPVYTRPLWFRNTLPAACFYFQAIKSSNPANGQGNVSQIYPSTPTETLPSVTSTASGGTAWANSVIISRGSNAVTGANVFVGAQTFAAGASALAPYKFQAGVVQTTPVAHSVEWDGNLMYLTNSSAVRNTNVAWPTSLAPTQGQWLTWDNTNTRWAPNTNVVVDSSGNFGIGVAAPGAKLQIYTQDGFRFNSSGAITTMRIGSATNTETTAEIAYDRNSGSTTFNHGATGSTLTERLRIDTNGNVYATSGATGMTGGFIWTAAAAGAPTTAPTTPPSGRVPMYYDTTANKLYVYNGGWKASAAFV